MTSDRSGLRADLSQALLRVSRRYKIVGATDPDQSEILFHPDIFLTGSLDELLETPDINETTTEISGSGNVLVKTIPSDERWKLLMMQVWLSSGVFTFNQWTIYNTYPSSDVPFTVHSEAGQTSVIKGFESPLPIPKGWEVKINIDGYTSVGDLKVRFYYLKSDDLS